MTTPGTGSHPDILGLDADDDTDSDPPTGVHDLRTLEHAKMALLNQGAKIKRAERRAARHESAIRTIHGVAVEARDDVREIRNTLTTALNTLKLIGAVLVGVGSLVAALAAGVGYALAHFTLH